MSEPFIILDYTLNQRDAELLKRIVSRVMLILLLTSILASTSCTSLTLAQSPQVDWIVTGSEVVENKSVLLNGNLIVKGEGNLTLSNVTLTINNGFAGQYGLSVESGGAIFIYNSKITASDLKKGFSFLVKGSHFVIKNSELHGAGWCDGDPTECVSDLSGGGWRAKSAFPYGLKIETNGAIIENNIISENAAGLTLTGSNATIRGNRFHSNLLAGIAIFGSTGSNFISNFINQTAPFVTAEVWMRDSNQNTFFNNTLTTINMIVVGNLIGAFGIDMINSWNNTIIDNRISASNTIILRGSSNNVITGNNLTLAESGVHILAGVNNRIVGNNFQTVAWLLGRTAIILSNAHNTTIANNSIFGNCMGIWLGGTSDSYILNNNITSESWATVVLFASQRNGICGNRLLNATTGIWLYYLSDSNIITNNQVEANGTFGWGILVRNCSANRIYQNNFMGDFKFGPYDDGNNSWDYEGKGNYWSPYKGKNRGDGIGDTPYQIAPNGIDRYPLTNPVALKPVDIPEMKFAPSPQPVKRTEFTNNTIEDAVAVIEAGYADVTNSLLIKNSTLTLKDFTVEVSDGGSFIIENSRITWERGGLVGKGGRATFINSTLVVGQKAQFLFLLQDLSEGSVTIVGSTIMSTPDGFGFIILKRSSYVNATVLIRNSRIQSYGTAEWITNGPIFLGGLDSFVIENSIIMGCPIGISSGEVRSLRLINNTFLGNMMSVFFRDTDVFLPDHHYESSVFMSGNNFDSGVEVIAGNVTFSDNVMVGGGLNLAGSDISLTRNNFFVGDIRLQSNNTTVDGNFWSNYQGKDANLDGVGDTPHVLGNDFRGREVKDSSPFMCKDGWLTRFWLTVETNFPYISFSVNKTQYRTGLDGTLSLRLGYIADYEISVAQDVQISEDSRLCFVKWEDGSMKAVRVTSLSFDAIIQASYVKQYSLKVISEFSETTGSGWYDAGTRASFSVKDVRVSANPFVGKVFKGWAGDFNELLQSASITMDGPKTIVAVWSDDFIGLYLVGGSAALAVAIAVGVLIMRKRPSRKPI